MIYRGELIYRKETKDKEFKLKMKMQKKIVKAVKFTKKEFKEMMNPKLSEDQKFERNFEWRDK